MSTPPPNWYPDPQSPTHLRYWDGTQWTGHVSPVAPAVAPAMAMPQPQKKQMSGAATAGIVVGIVAGVLVIFGILAAIAIPVFLNQRDKAAQIGAEASVAQAATALEYYFVDYPATEPWVTATSYGMDVATADGIVVQSVTFEDQIELGGFTSNNDGTWCVWVEGTVSDAAAFYSSTGALDEGTCP
ncbi:DUF2510 domain-containing protein [Demequina sp.]|uniref:DUF2510 domain-containing protein n=1 Tax=Demequina sp. TaxID=2050685 RepID=UPI003D116B6D